MDILLEAAAQHSEGAGWSANRGLEQLAVALPKVEAARRRVGGDADDADASLSDGSTSKGALVSPPTHSPGRGGAVGLALLCRSAPDLGALSAAPRTTKARARSFDARSGPHGGSPAAAPSAAAPKRARAMSCVAAPEPAVDAGRSIVVDGVPENLGLVAPAQPLRYEDLINFPRSRGKARARRCVMCGLLASGEDATCSIPLQNKDVCKRCDTGIWRHAATGEHFKWCKGCKKFLHVAAFQEKLGKCATRYAKQPSKCDRCRERGRQSYMSKRAETGGGAAAAAPARG